MRIMPTPQIRESVSRAKEDILRGKNKQEMFGFAGRDPSIEDISRTAYGQITEKKYSERYPHIDGHVSNFQEAFYCRYIFDPKLAADVIKNVKLSASAQLILIYNIFDAIGKKDSRNAQISKKEFKSLAKSPWICKDTKEEIKRLAKEIV